MVGLRTALGLSAVAMLVCVALMAVYLGAVARRDRRGTDRPGDVRLYDQSAEGAQ